MKTMTRLTLLAVCAAILLPACAHVSPAYQAVPGYWFSELHSPGFATADSVGDKHGMSSAESYVGLFARGDASINAAATEGGLTRVTHVDYKAFSVLGVYARIETYAYGK